MKERDKSALNFEVFSLPNPVLAKLPLKAVEAKQFVQQNKYNDNICFFIDMRRSSGQFRFFVYDLKKDTVRNSGLVTHGNCNQYSLEGRKYDNSVGCGCTSLGKYKVGRSYTGRFGLAYKLYGLEKTNNNAFERFVVLHAHECVPETPVDDEICQSNGCPTVSTGFLQYLKPIIDRSARPVLLWIMIEYTVLDVRSYFMQLAYIEHHTMYIRNIRCFLDDD